MKGKSGGRHKLSGLLFRTVSDVVITGLLVMVVSSYVNQAQAGLIIRVPSAYSTIQSAISAAYDGDVVMVDPGTYHECVNFQGKSITLQSTDPTDQAVVAATIIDGDEAGSVVSFNSSEANNSVLNGVTIQNGSSSYYGGGICCFSSSPTIENCIVKKNLVTGRYGGGGGIYCFLSSPVIKNCIITGNSVTGQNGEGGGICCDSSSTPDINNCTISDNSADYGGGIYGYDSSPGIESCIISDNSADKGGGICCDFFSTPDINNCTISGNSADYGGGMYAWDSSPGIESCIISDNSADYGGGIYGYYFSPTITNCIVSGNEAGYNGGGIYGYSSSPDINNCTISGNLAGSYGAGLFCLQYSFPTIKNCILWNDLRLGLPDEIYADTYSSPTITYSNVQDGYVGLGNIGADSEDDPKFVNPSIGDFHLLPDSPCIDTGTNETVADHDKDGRKRPMDGNLDDIYRCDMGAYEAPGPTVIELASFSAACTYAGNNGACSDSSNGCCPSRVGRIVITWSTLSEINTTGFNLWRSRSDEGERQNCAATAGPGTAIVGQGDYVRINPVIIEAQGGPTLAAEYSFIDDTAVPGVTYSYKLEDIDNSGLSTFHGPVSATIPQPFYYWPDWRCGQWYSPQCSPYYSFWHITF